VPDRHRAGFVEDVHRRRNETRSDGSQRRAFDLLPPRGVQVVVVVSTPARLQTSLRSGYPDRTPPETEPAINPVAAMSPLCRDTARASRRTSPLHCGTPDKVARHTACKLTQSPTQPELRKHATASPHAVFVVLQSGHSNSTSISSRISTSFPSQRRAIIHSALSTIVDTKPSLHRHGSLGRVRLKFPSAARLFLPLLPLP
jgi:hypothetical protein